MQMQASDPNTADATKQEKTAAEVTVFSRSADLCCRTPVFKTSVRSGYLRLSRVHKKLQSMCVSP